VVSSLLSAIMVGAIMVLVVGHHSTPVALRAGSGPGTNPGIATRVAIPQTRPDDDTTAARSAGGRSLAGSAGAKPVAPLDPSSGGEPTTSTPEGLAPTDPDDPTDPSQGPIPEIASPALTEIPPGWTSSTNNLNVGTMARSYLMIRPPPQSGTSLPVVIILHGRGLYPAIMERLSHLLPVVGRAIAVYPAGWNRSWNAGGCCGMAHRASVDDVGFLSEVVRQVLASQPDASARHVYLVGYSNGGRMAMDLACAKPGMFAGLAAVEAVPVAPCASTRPLPTVLVASSGDPLLSIPTDGARKIMQGYLEPTMGQTVDQWRQLDGCSPAASSRTTGMVVSTVWSYCRAQGRVQYDLYKGGSHRWPTGDGTTPSAATLISRFLWAGHA